MTEPMMKFDLAMYITRQRRWSESTFGPGKRTVGILEHIKLELDEIQAEPDSLEWIDVVILALDGAWRAGYGPAEIVERLEEKQRINMARRWPEPQPEDTPILHLK